MTTGFVLPSIKIVYYQHLLVSFEELLSLRLSDHFALVVGCINNNWLNLWDLSCGKNFPDRDRQHPQERSSRSSYSESCWSRSYSENDVWRPSAISVTLIIIFADKSAWCSEIGSLWSPDAPELHASGDVRELISLHQAVYMFILDPDLECHLLTFFDYSSYFAIFYRLLVNNLLLNSE